MFFMSQGGDWYDDATRLSLSPQIAVFSSSGMYYGGALYLINEPSIYSSENETRWAIGPVFGYYLNSPMNEFDVSGRSFPFVELAVTYGSIDYGFDSNINILSFSGTVGMTLMASNAVGLDFGASFTLDNFSSGGYSVSGTTIMLGVGISNFVF